MKLLVLQLVLHNCLRLSVVFSFCVLPLFDFVVTETSLLPALVIDCKGGKMLSSSSNAADERR